MAEKSSLVEASRKLVASAIRGRHLTVVDSHFHDNWIYGTFFVLASIIQFSTAVLLTGLVIVTSIEYPAK